MTHSPPGTTYDATEVEGPNANGGGGTPFAGVRRPIITVQGSNAVIICPGPHPVCGGVNGPSYYRRGQDTVTTV